MAITYRDYMAKLPPGRQAAIKAKADEIRKELDEMDELEEGADPDDEQFEEDEQPEA